MELPRARQSLLRRLVNRSADFSLRKAPLRPRRKATAQLRETRARLRTLRTVLPRSSSPESPLYFPSDPDLDSVFPELQTIASQSFLTFFDQPVHSTPQPSSNRSVLYRGNSLEQLEYSRAEKSISPQSEYWNYKNSRSRRDVPLPAIQKTVSHSRPAHRARCESAGPKVLYFFAKTEEVHKAYLDHIGRSR